MADLILRSGDSVSRAEVGGKAFALAELAESKLPIPEWFAVSPRAFEAALTEEEQNAFVHDPEGAEVELSGDVRQAVTRAANELADGGKVALAVRSSAMEEDAEAHSWAGQMESFLMVHPDAVCDRIVDVWRSVYGEDAASYREQHDLEKQPKPPAVLVQRMIMADAAGVAFSADPVSGRRTHCVVSAVHGAGSALVDGDTDADSFTVDRHEQIVERDIAEQQRIHELTADGVVKRDLDPPETKPALNDAQVLRVAELARNAAEHFGRPQDIEWAMSDGELFLLQSRPITTLRNQPDPDGRTILWDNSNIAESYSGVTTPLTFSFAKRAYSSVYRSFCRVMGVDEAVIQEHDETFQSMIGLIRGRIYYNLQSWYEMLALLPGFRFNRKFMEEMMGVSERMPPEHLPEPKQVGTFAKTTDLMRLVRSASALVRQHRKLPERIEKFESHLDAVLSPPDPGVEKLRLDELASFYKRIERELLAEWDVPIVNDFMTMVFSGLSKRMVQRWVEGDAASLHNRLMVGLDGVISVEPAKRIREMAEIASADDALVDLLSNASAAKVEDELERHPELNARYQEYLDRFSDRCLNELKLESPTVRDDPTVLFRAIGGMAARLRLEETSGSQKQEKEMRREAEQELEAALENRPVRMRLARWALRHARNRIGDRENLRFERTRVFGMARRLFLEMGRRLSAEGELTSPRDVFYLEVHEVLGFIDGTSTTTDLKGLVDVRKEEYERYRSAPPPDDRFVTNGPVPIGNTFRSASTSDHDEGMDERKGTGGCPGVVRAKVRVVRDPREESLQENEILVAERTDPGWVALFTSAAGVIVEHGNMLSHAAIVARELGIPAAVSIHGATEWLQTGDLVELNGETGVVRILETNSSPSS